MNIKIDEVDKAYVALIKAVNYEYTYLSVKEKNNLINEIGTLLTQSSDKNDQRRERVERKAGIKRLFKGKVTRK